MVMLMGIDKVSGGMLSSTNYVSNVLNSFTRWVSGLSWFDWFFIFLFLFSLFGFFKLFDWHNRLKNKGDKYGFR